MDVREIEVLANDFRLAADKASDWGAFGSQYPFSNFPKDCCDDMCDLFGQLLLEKEVAVFKIYGMYRYDNWEHQYSHVWIQLEDGIVVDLTGDQYKNNSIMLNYDTPCHVGEENDLYRLFSKDERRIEPYYGINCYGDAGTRKRLWDLYEIILSFYTSSLPINN